MQYEWTLPEGMEDALIAMRDAYVNYRSKYYLNGMFSICDRKYRIVCKSGYKLYLNDIRICSVYDGIEEYNENALTPELWSHIMSDLGIAYQHVLMKLSEAKNADRNKLNAAFGITESEG